MAADRAQAELVMDNNARAEDVINLNVRGTLLSVPRATLTAMAPEGSYFSALLSGRFTPNMDTEVCIHESAVVSDLVHQAMI